MTILYKFASRSRPSKFFDCLDNLKKMSASEDYHVLVTIDYDDNTMNNIAILNQIKRNYQNVTVITGNARSKVEAINSCIQYPHAPVKWDILAVHSDDMVFTQYGFDNVIREGFIDFSGLLHIPDGHANERLCTYPLMSKEYYQLDDFVYHPEFLSVYCDNFQQDLAIKRKKYKYLDVNILEHRHVAWGFGTADELMKKNESKQLWIKDKRTYIRLRKQYGI